MGKCQRKMPTLNVLTLYSLTLNAYLIKKYILSIFWYYQNDSEIL